MSAMLTIRPDDENVADKFWESLDAAMPSLADELRKNDRATVSMGVWDAVQKLEGLRDGPAHAREALLVVAE